MKTTFALLSAAGLLSTLTLAENCWVGTGAGYDAISGGSRIRDNKAPDGTACRHDLYGFYAQSASAIGYTSNPYALCCDDCNKLLSCLERIIDS